MREYGLPSHLPLFAVPGAVLMPHGRMPLTVFEPRYLQLVEDVLKTPERLVGLIQPQGDGYARIGAAGRLTGFQELDDGQMLISLRAVSRFSLIAVEDGFAPYAQGRVDWGGFDNDRRADAEEDPDFDREVFLRGLERYLEAHDLSTDWDSLDEAGDELLINALAMALPFEPEEKQGLLEAHHLSERRVLLEGLMEFAVHSQGDDGQEMMQ